jgi:hypothetical protein
VNNQQGLLRFCENQQSVSVSDRTRYYSPLPLLMITCITVAA